ncbi:class I SAM-dependent methyltransferase [Roseibium sp. MMSF_3544]|uniref:class I SAM-dependent methyltransferase n=1 Tax=unclassified Roseibium TaxID=2629323 RepID=UPI00273E1DD1|nr:class I SAM-dependent methyltransferase [Roseibium sp. MMSF_3544]
MSGFSAEWLALREPVDLAARNRDVEAAFVEQLPDRAPKLLDLASGAGSTVAALRDRIPVSASWQLTDYDQALLDVAARRWQDKVGGELSYRRIDLAASLEDLPFRDVDAITTSAFLDLVSEAFLSRLVDCITQVGKPFLASLTYDGRVAFHPIAGLDQAMHDVLNRDQKTDKGFGRALGPDAAQRAVELFMAKGYRVEQGKSDWQAGPVEQAFLDEFLDGWVGVGLKNGLAQEDLEEWRQKRADDILSGDFKVTIGHIDFAAFPR